MMRLWQTIKISSEKRIKDPDKQKEKELNILISQLMDISQKALLAIKNMSSIPWQTQTGQNQRLVKRPQPPGLVRLLWPPGRVQADLQRLLGWWLPGRMEGAGSRYQRLGNCRTVEVDSVTGCLYHKSKYILSLQNHQLIIVSKEE